MKKIIFLMIGAQLMGCASSKLAKNFSTMSFDEKASGENLKSIGNIEGKDCTWNLFGWQIGESPNVRNAFSNAVNQKEMNLIPGEQKVSKGEPLKVVKNVSVNSDGFGIWIVGRSCVIVTGVGLQ